VRATSVANHTRALLFAQEYHYDTGTVLLSDRLREVLRLWQAMAPRGERRTQEEVGAAVGVSKGAISNYIAGRDVPSLDKIESLARFFGVHPGWLAFGWEPRTGVAPEGTAEVMRVAEQIGPPYGPGRRRRPGE
jgi:DNA-binding XRE family transcriptional regulator